MPSVRNVKPILIVDHSLREIPLYRVVKMDIGNWIPEISGNWIPDTRFFWVLGSGTGIGFLDYWVSGYPIPDRIHPNYSNYTI